MQNKQKRVPEKAPNFLTSRTTDMFRHFHASPYVIVFAQPQRLEDLYYPISINSPDILRDSTCFISEKERGGEL
jgi:hypothetical protein